MEVYREIVSLHEKWPYESSRITEEPSLSLLLSLHSFVHLFWNFPLFCFIRRVTPQARTLHVPLPSFVMHTFPFRYQIFCYLCCYCCLQHQPYRYNVPKCRGLRVFNRRVHHDVESAKEAERPPTKSDASNCNSSKAQSRLHASLARTFRNDPRSGSKQYKSTGMGMLTPTLLDKPPPATNYDGQQQLQAAIMQPM